MRHIISTALVLVLVSLSLTELLSYRAEVSLQEAHEASEEVAGEVVTRAEREKELEMARAAADSLGAGPDAFIHLARIYRRFAGDTQNPAEQIEYFCNALEAYGKALKKEPYHATYLVNWANIRQLLGGADCGERKYTKGDFSEAVKLALQRDPTNIRVLYAAGMVYDWAGEKDESRKAFREVLSLDSDLDEGWVRVRSDVTSSIRNRMSFILQKIDSPEALKAVVPARFPQVVVWSNLVKERDEDQFDSWWKAIEEMQLQAIDESAAAYQDGDLPAELHQRRLVRLLPFVASSKVRARIDTELAAYYKRAGKSEMSDYFANRARFKKLAVIKTFLESDTRPQKSSLFNWGADPVVMFDKFYTTAGFYLPDRQSLRLIELHNRKGPADLSENHIKVFASGDNETWQEIGAVQVQKFTIEGNSVVALLIESEHYKYWKVHFGSSSREKTFGNNLDALLVPYGFSELTN